MPRAGRWPVLCTFLDEAATAAVLLPVTLATGEVLLPMTVAGWAVLAGIPVEVTISPPT